MFFSVFGSRGLPRESQEARQGSQETPKETPKGIQKLAKKWLKSETNNGQKKRFLCGKKIALTGLGFGVFEAMGLSKKASFEDVKKLFNMSNNGPKMIQKWFKIAQIVKDSPKNKAL